ncbi:MAG: 6,7-dimethyl-8-ribityllumazine synthase [Bacteroidetes bacterium 4572_112]|nr:MAG: 6,7-dimethyl-8-ribityllumazine synthase [Bacteroidetes bacterium 4572_112]
MASSLKNLSDYKETALNIVGAKIGILISEWNDGITNAMAQGAIDTMIKNGIAEDDIYVRYVPGTFELAYAAQQMSQYKPVNAVICIGCVIQGETRHFDFISQASANAVANVAINNDIPVIFGVLTTDNLQQAQDRAGGKHGNKGIEAGITAIKMISMERDMQNEFDDEDWSDFYLEE